MKAFQLKKTKYARNIDVIIPAFHTISKYGISVHQLGSIAA
jgi:hypothetical protein